MVGRADGKSVGGCNSKAREHAGSPVVRVLSPPPSRVPSPSPSGSPPPSSSPFKGRQLE